MAPTLLSSSTKGQGRGRLLSVGERPKCTSTATKVADHGGIKHTVFGAVKQILAVQQGEHLPSGICAAWQVGALGRNYQVRPRSVLN